MRTQQGSAHVIVIIVLVLALLGALGYIFWQNFMQNDTQTKSVNSFAECIKAKDSKLQESYPEVCVTKDGQSFTNPDQVGTSDATNKKTAELKDGYLKKEKLSFKYPSNWSLETSSSDATEQMPASDTGVLKNQEGETVLSLLTGISGIGGACDPGIRSTFTVTAIDDTQQSGLFAAKAIYYDEEKGYTSFIYLTKDKAIKSFKTCLASHSVLYGTDRGGSVAFGTYPWNPNGGGIQNYYDTREEAQQKLDSDDWVTAYSVLQSVHY